MAVRVLDAQLPTSWVPPRLSVRERARSRLRSLLLPLARRLERGRLDELSWTLHRAARTLQAAGVPFAVAGGVARWVYGGPETSHDLDLLVLPGDLDRARDVLTAAGMRPGLVCGWGQQLRDGRTEVDLICSPAGQTITEAVLRRARTVDVYGLPMPVVSLEDDFAFKLLALTERCPSYKSLLVAARCLREQVDWEAVRRRTSGSPFAAGFFAIADGLGLTAAHASGRGATRQLPLPTWLEGGRRAAR